MAAIRAHRSVDDRHPATNFSKNVKRAQQHLPLDTVSIFCIHSHFLFLSLIGADSSRSFPFFFAPPLFSISCLTNAASCTLALWHFAPFNSRRSHKFSLSIASHRWRWRRAALTMALIRTQSRTTRRRQLHVASPAIAPLAPTPKPFER